MILTEKIERITVPDRTAFTEQYVNTSTPVVITNIASDTAAGRHWSIGYFRDRFGDLEVDVIDNARKRSDQSAYTGGDLRMPFGEYLDTIARNEPTGLRIFLFNLFRQYPSLQQEFPCPEFFRGTLSNLAYMFFGGKNTTVRIHFDIDMSHVLHTHFGGRKRVVLIAPEYSDALYRLPLNTYSLIDPDNPDYTKYPALKNVKGYDFILEPGETVFMPAGYWHYMTYLEASFSVSYRKLSSSLADNLAGALNLGLRLPADKLLLKIAGNSWFRFKQQFAEQRAMRWVRA